MSLEETLLDRLEFDAEKGVFRWKPEFLPVKGRKNGKAGSIDWSGYDVICFRGKRLKVHRLVWLLHHGRPLPEMLDHIDGNPANNRLENLRPSNVVANGHNRAEHRRGQLLGTCFSQGKWMAQAWIKGKKHFFGYHKTMEDAHAAYLAGVKRLSDELDAG